MLRWSWFLKNDLWLWTFLHMSCSASATSSVDKSQNVRDDVDTNTSRREECIYLQGFGDPGFGGLVDLSLPDSAAAALPQLTQTEAQILLIRIIFNLQHNTGETINWSRITL